MAVAGDPVPNASVAATVSGAAPGPGGVFRSLILVFSDVPYSGASSVRWGRLLEDGRAVTPAPPAVTSAAHFKTGVIGNPVVDWRPFAESPTPTAFSADLTPRVALTGPGRPYRHDAQEVRLTRVGGGIIPVSADAGLADAVGVGDSFRTVARTGAVAAAGAKARRGSERTAEDFEVVTVSADEGPSGIAASSSAAAV